MKLNIAIVGAGVSGIILGSLLKKYLNVNISIFEKRNQLFNNINGLQLTPNSTQILDLINFSEIFKKEEFLSIEKLKVHDLYSGELLSEILLKFNQKQKYISINRSLFLKNIFQYFKLSENIIYEEIKDIDSQNNEIIVKNKKFFFDYIFLCDGIFSKLKKNIADQSISFSGLYALRGTYDLTNDNSSNINLWLGENEHMVNYKINNFEISQYNYVWITKNLQNLPISTQNYDENNQYLHEMFKKKFSEKFNFIGKTKSISVWPIYKTKNIFFGYKNIFCLGDSSHGFIPSRAQGASQAIEDAYVLFKLLEKNNLNQKNLANKRLRRIKKIIRKSEKTVFIYHLRNSLLKFFRNSFLKIFSNSKIFSRLLNKDIFNFKL